MRASLSLVHDARSQIGLTLAALFCLQGAGNALYPIFEANKNPDLTIHGFDYSKSAVDVVKVRRPQLAVLPLADRY